MELWVIEPMKNNWKLASVSETTITSTDIMKKTQCFFYMQCVQIKNHRNFIAQSEADIKDLQSGLELMNQQNKQLLAELKAQNTKESMSIILKTI